MNELPEGWIKTSLGEIASWGSGGTPSRSEKTFYKGTIPWIKSGELTTRYVKESEEYITEAAIRGSSAKIFPAGSVAIAMYGATIGKTAILAVDAATNQACAVGVPLAGLVSADFLYRLLQNEKDAFIEKGKGGAQPNISQAVIKAHEIYLPALAEQNRIAQKLDELLTQVDILKSRVDAIPALLKRFRQSALAAASSGLLTTDWREANKKSKTEKWSYPKIGDVGHVQLGRQRSPKYHSGENMRPYLRVQNVFENRIDLSDVMEMDFPASDFERYKLHHGDILLNEGQSPELLGRPAMFRSEIEDACFTNTLIRFKATPQVLPEYALIVFRNYMHSGRFRSIGTITTNIAHLGAGRFANLDFPLPTRTEQTEIVRRVEQLFAFADQLEAKVQSAKARIDKLTQSILAKAFRGELVPQDPNDEPASVLLERIKAQRAAEPKAKRGRKKAESA